MAEEAFGKPGGGEVGAAVFILAPEALLRRAAQRAALVAADLRGDALRRKLVKPGGGHAVERGGDRAEHRDQRLAALRDRAAVGGEGCTLRALQQARGFRIEARRERRLPL